VRKKIGLRKCENDKYRNSKVGSVGNEELRKYLTKVIIGNKKWSLPF